MGGARILVAQPQRDDRQVHARLQQAAVTVNPRNQGSGFPMKLPNYMAEGNAIVASAGFVVVMTR